MLKLGAGRTNICTVTMADTYLCFYLAVTNMCTVTMAHTCFFLVGIIC